MEIILASNSPRRKEILKKAGYDFIVIPSNYNEKINGLKYCDSLVENCAYQKAFDIQNRFGSEKLIISSDTVVVNKNIILGKPKDENEAFEMLLGLSDKTHFVASSICLIYQEKILKGIEKTYVTFRKLTPFEIKKYIETKNPLDKAGSYGIQDEGFDFAYKIEGNLDNVIGFPMELFKDLLNKINV